MGQPGRRQWLMAFAAVLLVSAPTHPPVIPALAAPARLLAGALGDAEPSEPRNRAHAQSPGPSRAALPGGEPAVPPGASSDHDPVAPQAPAARTSAVDRPETIVGAAGGADVHRLAGASRIGTAIEISRAVFETATAVVLARADDFADALVGAPFAARAGAPILLTDPDRVPEAVADELERLQAREIVLLGGEDAVSAEAEAALAARYQVRRIGGRDRFATAAAVAREIPAARTAFVAAGGSFPDALSAAPYAAFTASPILLVGDGVSQATAEVLSDLGPAEIVVLGGPAAVSERTEQALAAHAPAIRRLAGPTRFETAAAVYDDAVANGMDPRELWLATGANFPDALAAGPAVAIRGATLRLVSGADLWRQRAIVERIRGAREDLASVYLLGGPAAITGDAVAQLGEITAPGPLLPRGGRTLFPRHRLVAFYGNAESAAMGVLGETSPDEAGRRLLEQAAPYGSAERPLLGAFEMIVTVAERAPGPDGLYRSHAETADIQRYLDAARRIDALLLIDVQPGRSDFLTEVRRYEEFLKEPDVGVALDPEWRMGPTEVPGTVVGSVDAAEINEVSAYVADLVYRHDLPQKLFVIHQFTHSMVTDRDQVVAREGLAITFHIDGFGSRAAKLSNYGALSVDAPFHNGIKLFYDEDIDLFTPADVLGFAPSPDLISYQ